MILTDYCYYASIMADRNFWLNLSKKIEYDSSNKGIYLTYLDPSYWVVPAKHNKFYYDRKMTWVDVALDKEGAYEVYKSKLLPENFDLELSYEYPEFMNEIFGEKTQQNVDN